MSGTGIALDSITAIDAHISRLHEEIQRLRTARNTLVPFGRLPDELLVHVARYFTQPKPLYATSMVCSRFRTVIVNTPELWANIDCNWPLAMVTGHLIRAASHALVMSARIDQFWPHLEGIIEDALPRTNSLTLEVQSDSDRIMHCLAETESQLLRSLVLEASWDNDQLDLREMMFSSSIRSYLSTLHLQSMSVSSFPALPALRNLALRNVRYTLAHLHELLSRTPFMEELKVTMTRREGPLPNLSCVNLPHLHSLSLADDWSWVSSILLMLPNPSKHFKVFCFYSFDTRTWTSMRGPNAAIVSRLSKFWNTVTSEAANFPQGTVENFTNPDCGDEQNPSLVFKGHVSLRDGNDTATFYYKSFGEITEEDPFLDHIDTLSLSCSRRTYVGLDPHCINLDYLPSLRKLVLAEVKRGPWVSTEDGFDRTLEDWVLDRAQNGKPLELIEFYDCHVRARALFKGLRGAQAAQTTTWSDLKAPLLQTSSFPFDL
jgi:hypothetical protein